VSAAPPSVRASTPAPPRVSIERRGRTIIVGDLHACHDELAELLEWIGFVKADQLICVGDVVVRGPYPRATIDLLRRVDARSVRGNHEDKLLRHHDDPRTPIGNDHQRAAARLKKRHWAYLRAMPLWIDLPEHGIRVVHAGVVPGVPIERQLPKTLLYVRSLGPGDEPLDRRDRVLWGERYAGPPHIVFGHNAMPTPQLHPWATGIDTGCVYGGRLTAMVLRAGEAPPPLADRRDALVSVSARKRYSSG
jgi:hypothetical protein